VTLRSISKLPAGDEKYLEMEHPIDSDDDDDDVSSRGFESEDEDPES
jgi:hypothetical protein